MQLISKVTLNALTEHKGWSVRDLAREARVNRSTVGHLMSGKRDTCRSENAKAIARTLGVPVDALFRAQVSSVLPATRPLRRSA